MCKCFYIPFMRAGWDLIKPQDFLPIRKFVHRMKGSKRNKVNGQIFELAANLWLYLEKIFDQAFPKFIGRKKVFGLFGRQDFYPIISPKI